MLRGCEHPKQRTLTIGFGCRQPKQRMFVTGFGRKHPKQQSGEWQGRSPQLRPCLRKPGSCTGFCRMYLDACLFVCYY